MSFPCGPDSSVLPFVLWHPNLGPGAQERSGHASEDHSRGVTRWKEMERGPSRAVKKAMGNKGAFRSGVWNSKGAEREAREKQIVGFCFAHLQGGYRK